MTDRTHDTPIKPLQIFLIYQTVYFNYNYEICKNYVSLFVKTYLDKSEPTSF